MRKINVELRDSLFIELLCLVIILLCITLTAVFYFTDTTLTQNEQNWLKGNNSTVSFASANTAYPFSYWGQDGVYSGVISDAASFIGEQFDIRLNSANFASMDAALDGVRNGSVDLVGAVILTGSVPEGVFASEAYAALSDVVVKAGTSPISSGKIALDGLRVAVSGSILDSETIHKTYSTANQLTITATLDGAMQLLGTGRVDAVIALAAPVRQYFAKHPASSQRIVGSTGAEYVLTFLLEKENVQLRSIVNKGLRTLGDKEHAVILESWFGVSQKGQFLGWNVRKTLTFLGGIFILFTSIVLIWNRKLRKDVHQQNRLVLIELAERKLTEHKLLRNQGLMQSIFNASQNVYYVFDELCVCQKVITSREDLLGFCHDVEPVGEKLTALFDAKLAATVREALLKSLDCKQLQIIEYRVERNGVVKWMEGRALTLAHSGCGPRKIVWIARDITEEKRNREGVQVLSTQLALSEEQQRRKIAVELHDSLGQILAIVKMRLNLLKRKVTEPESCELMDTIMEQLGGGIELTRTLVWELSPPTLYALGLVSAVEWLGEKYTKEYGINFSVEDSMECSVWGNDFKILMFRIVRELMANVVKHSRADSCEIEFHSRRDGIVITVCDNGVGFKENMPDKGFRKGFGLLTIQESVRHLGGDVTFSSDGAGGCVFTFIPFKKAAPSLEDELNAAVGA